MSAGTNATKANARAAPSPIRNPRPNQPIVAMPSNLTSVSISRTSCGVSACSVVIRVLLSACGSFLVPAQYSAGRAGLAHRQVLALDLPRTANDARTPQGPHTTGRPAGEPRPTGSTDLQPAHAAYAEARRDQIARLGWNPSRNSGGATGSGPAQVDQTLPNTARHEPTASEPVLREPG